MNINHGEKKLGKFERVRFLHYLSVNNVFSEVGSGGRVVARLTPDRKVVGSSPTQIDHRMLAFQNMKFISGIFCREKGIILVEKRRKRACLKHKRTLVKSSRHSIKSTINWANTNQNNRERWSKIILIEWCLPIWWSYQVIHHGIDWEGYSSSILLCVHVHSHQLVNQFRL